LAVPRTREGVYGGAKIFGSALLQPARSVCVCLERFFIIYVLHISLTNGFLIFTVGRRHVEYSSKKSSRYRHGQRFTEVQSVLQSAGKFTNHTIPLPV